MIHRNSFSHSIDVRTFEDVIDSLLWSINYFDVVGGKWLCIFEIVNWQVIFLPYLQSGIQTYHLRVKRGQTWSLWNIDCSCVSFNRFDHQECSFLPAWMSISYAGKQFEIELKSHNSDWLTLSVGYLRSIFDFYRRHRVQKNHWSEKIVDGKLKLLKSLTKLLPIRKKIEMKCGKTWKLKINPPIHYL